MSHPLLVNRSAKTVPVWCLNEKEWKNSSGFLSTSSIEWANSNGFSAKSGQICTLPGETGKIAGVLFGMDSTTQPMAVGKLARTLPAGSYRLDGETGRSYGAALGWLLGGYKFTHYNGKKITAAKLAVSSEIDRDMLTTEANATALARDLINTPANDMGPDELEKAARKLARDHSAKISVIKGDQLLKKNFPMIHAVGRASANAPRLIDIKWGGNRGPKITLVGKGVIFDTGGLNIKPGGSMALMKKDMGGAANVLALAQMIMASKLKVRLRVLIPTVENAISGNAFRPGDVLSSRKGITVEIGNTDAEGRLILGDALALGDEESPDLMIDMATLTGAARVALGPDLPPFYTDDEEFAGQLSASAASVHDPLWRMPLWPGYHEMLSSKIADINHISAGGFAGSVTAALFLSRFVEKASTWTHLDIYGWNPKEKPWVPVGGEAQGIRALFAAIREKFSV